MFDKKLLPPEFTTAAALTVTESVSVKLPSAVVTVIVAEPAKTAVINPVLLTVATEGLFEDHDTLELLALNGAIVMASWSVPPAVIVDECSLRVTPVTETLAVVTVICSVPLTLEPSVAVTVTVTFPTPVAVNNPEELIVAEPVPLVADHDTFWLVALVGVIDALICRVLPLITVVAEFAPVTTIFEIKTFPLPKTLQTPLLQ